MEIPVDMYTSSAEIVICMPIGGTQKKSIQLRLDDSILVIQGTRELPVMKQTLIPIQEQCYRGVFEKRIQLPPHVYFDKIHCDITAENILIVTVPKILKPDVIPVTIL